MTLRVINPATGEEITQLDEDTEGTIAKKLEAARAAQPAWAARPLSERAGVLTRFRDALVRDTDELARVLSKEMGKPVTQARAEIRAVAPRIDFFLANAERAVQPDELTDPATGGGMRERITYEPLGVIANVSAWNYPYFVGSNVYAPALLLGNAVLYKPSELAAMSGLAMARLLHEAGVPEVVFAPIIGGGSVGAALVQAPVDGVFFTGSVGTGRKIAETAARRIIPVQLELGGKDPAYVCDDMDPGVAARAVADGAFYNTGQSCCAVERVYVHRAIAAPFIDAFVKTVRGFRVGDPAAEDTYIGPLTRPQQRAVLEGQIADAVAKGAEVLTGGKAIEGRGYYFEPTVLSKVDSSMAVMRDESFGPLIGIQEVSGDDEALQLMNDSDYGLTAGVFTHDGARAERMLAHLQAGSAYWNCCDRVSPCLPWTGRKQSGVGVTLGLQGMRALVQPKAWHLRSELC